MNYYRSGILRKLFYAFMFCCGVFLTSCASNSGVVSIGDNEYFIAKQASTGFPGTGGIKTDALKEAGEYCKSQNKSLDIINLDENDGPFVLGRYPRVELTFICE
jgi:hypothetical protein